MEAEPVSILTRAFARVQQEALGVVRAWKEFQSSLELSPECNVVVHSKVLGDLRSFNPHSSFRPSATVKGFD